MPNETKRKKRFYASIWFWVVLVVLAVWFIVHDMNQATIKTKSMGDFSPKSTVAALINDTSTGSTSEGIGQEAV